MTAFITGNPSEDFPVLPGGLRVVGGQMGGFFPAPVPGTPFNDSMTLFVSGQDSGGTSLPMNLFIAGGNPQAQASLPLFLFNDRSDLAGAADLFIQGAGENPGYSPLAEGLNLYVARGPNAGMTLFLCNHYVAGGVPLSITGSGSFSTYVPPRVEAVPSSLYGRYRYGTFRYNVQALADVAGSTTPALALSIRGSGGDLAGSAPLFVAGTVAAPLAGSVTLAMPATVGPVSNTAPLYVHGFNY
jgi:hypothetical protein